MKNKVENSSLLLSRPRGVLPWLCAIALPLLGACSDGGDKRNDVVAAVPFAELFEQGIDRYLGLYTPMSSTAGPMAAAAADNVVTYTFGAGDGPLCLDGSEYSMATRDAGSENLVIFLQGGGARWSTFDAASQNVAAQLVPGIFETGILDQNREDNPVKDWNLVYLPYCDGGLHASDKDNDYDDDGIVESPQRGLHNLSAALDVAVNTFPQPERILLTGNSAGGFGTTFALPLVSKLYPDTPIDVVNDSGVGIGKPGDPGYLMLLMSDWNQAAFIPESCPDCLAEDGDGHLTNYQIWQLDQNPQVRRGYMSYTQDSTIADFFLQIGGPAFEEALYQEMAQAEDAHPERVRSWIPAGNGHTFILAEPDKTAGGVSVMAWITAMLERSDEWVSTTD